MNNRQDYKFIVFRINKIIEDIGSYRQMAQWILHRKFNPIILATLGLLQQVLYFLIYLVINILSGSYTKIFRNILHDIT